MGQTTNEKIPFLRLLYKNLLLEILMITLCVLLVLGYSIYNQNTYYTVNQSVMLSTSISSSLGQSSQSSNASHGKLYIPMVKDSITNPQAIKQANELYKEYYPDSAQSIQADKINVTYKKNSLIFIISYTDIDEKVSKEKLAVVFEVAKEQLKKDIKGEVDLILTDGVDINGNVRYYSIVTSDDTVRNVIIGAIAGFVLSLSIVLLKYFADTTVKDKEELENLTGVSVLSFVENCTKKG